MLLSSIENVFLDRFTLAGFAASRLVLDLGCLGLSQTDNPQYSRFDNRG